MRPAQVLIRLAAAARLVAVASCLAAQGMAATAAADPPVAGQLPDRSRREAPLELRGQFPLALPFIDVTPRTAFLVPGGTLRWRFDLSYLSTHAASNDMLERYADDDFATLGGAVTEATLVEVAEASQSGHAYYVDGETARLAAALSWGMTDRLEIDATLPLYLHSGGILDGAIDSFHDRLNLPDGGRPDFAHDQYVVGLTDDGTTVFRGDAPGGLGLGDLLLEARVLLAGGKAVGPAAGPAGGFALTGTGSIEIPTGDTDRFEGNGSIDVAAGLAATWRKVRSTWHLGGGYALPGRWDPAPDLAPRNRVAAYASTAVLVGDRSAFLVGIRAVDGPFGREKGGTLGRVSIETSFGMRYLTRAGASFEAAFLENLTMDHNVPDVGFYISWGLNFRPRV